MGYKLIPLILVGILMLGGCSNLIMGGMDVGSHNAKRYKPWKLELTDELSIEREKVTGEIHIKDLDHITILDPIDAKLLYWKLREDAEE